MSEFVSVVSRPLTQAEQEINATYIYNYLGSRGWTVNAIAGMLGNFESESTINPGRWQGDVETGAGWGLAQWTPSEKYTDWCAERGLEWSHMDSALMRIEWELENGEQFYSTKLYPITFKQFKVSTKDPYWLAGAFVRNYERPASILGNDPELRARVYKKRGNDANAWYQYLTGLPAPSTPEAQNKNKTLPLLLMWAATRR